MTVPRDTGTPEQGASLREALDDIATPALQRIAFSSRSWHDAVELATDALHGLGFQSLTRLDGVEASAAARPVAGDEPEAHSPKNGEVRAQILSHTETRCGGSGQIWLGSQPYGSPGESYAPCGGCVDCRSVAGDEPEAS